MHRLILGCGKHRPKQAGELYLDLRPFEGVDVVHDLNTTPWPFEDSSFESAEAVHVIEHLRDLVSFMDEAWRVLMPGGDLYVETPLAGADPDLEFCDPTHVRCYRIHSFENYFTLHGVRDFGYTQRAWNPVVLEVRNRCVVFHGHPIKAAV